MNTGIVAARYAKALLYFATQNGEAELVYAEMQQLDRNFRELQALRNIPNNPNSRQCTKERHHHRGRSSKRRFRSEQQHTALYPTRGKQRTRGS